MRIQPTMIFFSVFLALVFVYNPLLGQEKNSGLVLDITIPCSNNGSKFIDELTTAYKELPFAQGIFTIKPVRAPNFVSSRFYMYVSKDMKTFSIFSLTDVEGQPVACILIGGENLKPYITKEN